jgi:D-3-phosphoglycerate dehydrogenase
MGLTRCWAGPIIVFLAIAAVFSDCVHMPTRGRIATLLGILILSFGGFDCVRAGAPSITIHSGTNREAIVTSRKRVTVRGTSASNAGIATTQYRVGRSGWRSVSGSDASWKFRAAVKPGHHTIAVRAVSNLDQAAVTKVAVIRKQLQPSAWGPRRAGLGVRFDTAPRLSLSSHLPMQLLKVLVADPVSQRGVDELAAGNRLEVTVQTGLPEAELIKIIPEFSALVVRSQTKVTAAVLEAATSLKVIGRAGVGVDNVDVDAATRRGIIVMNTPGGNTISTAEHAFSLLMSIARSIPQAHSSMKSGKWDRKKYEGVELYSKTLGVLGMGRIGTEVARRAIAFGMRVLAYDPYLSASKARTLQVELIDSIDELLPQADFLTCHMPLTDETRHMLDARRLALCKKGVRIVNAARGGLIDETALAESLASGHVAAAALDVFEEEPPPAEFPLRELPNAVFTPHLGASTAEAQENVGIEIAQAIRAALLDGEIRNAVNVPSIDARTLAVLGPWIHLCDSLGRFLSQTAPKRADTIRIRFSGKISEQDVTPLSRSILTGYLRQVAGSEVNQVNAPALAKNLGIKVIESRHSEAGDFSELIEVFAEARKEKASVGGTFYGAKPRIVTVNQHFVEILPQGVVLLLENRDRPGIVGHIGTLLGEHNVNIAGMSLSRDAAGGKALTLLNLDSAPGHSIIQRLLADSDLFAARVIKL